VVSARAASRITSAGPQQGEENWYLILVTGSVAPPYIVYSPPESEVGIAMTGTVGAFAFASCWVSKTFGRRFRSSIDVTAFARPYIY